MRKETRVSSFVSQANQLIKAKNMTMATKLIKDGLNHYSNRITKALSPYAVADAALLVVSLRHIADEIEARNPGAKELVQYLDAHAIKPQLREKTKVKIPNQYPGEN